MSLSITTFYARGLEERDDSSVENGGGGHWARNGAKETEGVCK